MKKIFKYFLLSNVVLFSISNAEGISHLTASIGSHTPFDKDSKTTLHYTINLDLFKFYDNDIAIGFQGVYGSSSDPQNGKNFTSARNIIIDSNLLLGYKILVSDYSVAFFSGIGLAPNMRIRWADNKEYILSYGSFYIPFVIWNRYEVIKNVMLYSKFQYNFNYSYSYSNGELGNLTPKINKISNIGHELKFNAGLEYSIINIGFFTNFYSLPHFDKKRINSVAYGANIGFSF